LKILLLWIGKTKSPHLLSLLQNYEGRIRHFCPLEINEIKVDEEPVSSRLIVKEGRRILAKIQSEAYVVVLDQEGESFTSEKFSEFIAEKRDHSLKILVFVIGGAFGVCEALKNRANKLLSLSRMTLNHQLARLVLVEQIYRAFTLIHNTPYHK
jgi:23S rRNA (pseudouridine1915-N3)-methyltransferase